MTVTSTQTELSTCLPILQKSLSELIAELVQEHGGRWEGTATQLAEVLPANLTPRALSQQLNQLQHELEKYGIVVTRTRRGDRRLLVLSYTHIPHTIETTLRHPIQPTSRYSDANCEEQIRFPFSWPYGTITALSDAEKEEVNRERRSGQKRYYKFCSLCGGNGGKLAFRKVSDGNACLLCRECAERYVKNALKREAQ
jgi:hypothetical protein